MSNNAGGPAFPTDSERQIEPSAYHFEGMTLRDYFAAKAMQGMYANSCDDYDFEGVALAAYATADAMIALRAA